MTMSKPNVVLIDDEKDLLDVLRSGLQEEFHVHPFTDPLTALTFLEKNPVDAIVLDYHIPGRSAHETFMELKMRKHQQPVLFLTGETDLTVKLNTLDLGVEDFLQKPIALAELSAYLRNRIRTHKRRHPQVVKLANLELNLKDPEVKVADRPVSLTPKEFEILSMLVTHPNVVVKKTDMVKKIWNEVKVEENNIDTHMSNLRKKLTGFEGKIKTIKCVGYALRV